MNNVPGSPDALEMEAAVKAEQIRLLYHQGVPIQLLGVVTAVIAVVMFRNAVGSDLLYLWFFAVITVTALRLSLNYRFSQLPGNEIDLSRWGGFYMVGTCASGALWGTLSLFYSPGWPVEHQVVLFVIYTGIIAGAFTTNSSVRWAFRAFYLPPVAILMYVMLSHVSRFGELAALFAIYIVLMDISSRRYHQRLTESLRIRVANEVLAKALEKSNQRLKELSERDELTSLHNRRSMVHKLKDEWARLYRSGKPLSLLFIDIDYFKQYNDTYGHIQGDEVLKQAADVFRQHAKRAADMAARFGGEEFAIVLPETEHTVALQIAEQVRQGMESLKIEHIASSCSDCVTVSLGVATMMPARGKEVTALQSEADRALYEAKKNGRNRVLGVDCPA